MSKFKVPESLDGLSIDDLLDLTAAGKKAAADLVKDDDAATEDIEQAEAIVAFIEQAQARITEIRGEEKERADKLARIRTASAEEEPEEDEDEDAEAPESDEAEEPTAEVEASTEEVEPELEAVAASATTKSSARRRAAENAPEPEAPVSTKTMSITAAADISGIPAGKEFADLTEVTDAAIKRLAAFPKTRIGGANGTRIRQGIATFNIGSVREDGLYIGNPDFSSDQAVLEEASRERRLSGNSLVAAGTWCAPADTLMGFCVEESTDGILDLPTVSAPRGAVRFTHGPDFADVFADADGDWNYTTTQVEADTEKPCTVVECPDWTEVELDVTGVCIGAGILTNAAYPELVRRYTEVTLVAHQHKVATRSYATILAGSTALTFASGATTITDALGHLELAAEYVRQTKRMARSTTFEVLLPYYVRAVFRADLARRNGVDLINVTDQRLDQHLAIRGIRAQWLYNVGDITNTAGALTIPATLQFPLYKAGTWVRLTKDVITLDGIYDSTNIKTNTYTSLFTEEGIKVVNMCGTSYKVTVPLVATGATGAQSDTADNFPHPA